MDNYFLGASTAAGFLMDKEVKSPVARHIKRLSWSGRQAIEPLVRLKHTLSPGLQLAGT
jgi:hypothetical protein